MGGASGDCGSSNWRAPLQPNAPVRDCPENYTLGTARNGARYCVPDRTIRE